MSKTYCKLIHFLVFWRIFISHAMTPHMQTPVEDLSTPKIGRLLGLSGWSSTWKFFYRYLENCISWCIKQNLSCSCWWTWVWMFTSVGKIGMLSDADFCFFGNGIFYVKSWNFLCFYQVMEHCVAHLDIAMFNAILRGSENEIPMDTISDPIVDSRVLPILAGDLSFGSGTQLKNSVCA